MDVPKEMGLFEKTIETLNSLKSLCEEKRDFDPEMVSLQNEKSQLLKELQEKSKILEEKKGQESKLDQEISEEMSQYKSKQYSLNIELEAKKKENQDLLAISSAQKKVLIL